MQTCQTLVVACKRHPVDVADSNESSLQCGDETILIKRAILNSLNNTTINLSDYNTNSFLQHCPERAIDLISSLPKGRTMR